MGCKTIAGKQSGSADEKRVLNKMPAIHFDVRPSLTRSYQDLCGLVKGLTGDAAMEASRGLPSEILKGFPDAW